MPSIYNQSGECVYTGPDAFEKLGEDGQFPFDKGFTIKNDPPRRKRAPDTPQGPTQGGEISDLALARQRRHNAWFDANGFSLHQTVVPVGMRVLDIGDENFRISRAEHDEKPDAPQAVDNFVKIIDAEKREDKRVVLSKIRMDDNGRLVGPSGRGYPITKAGLQALLAQDTNTFPSAFQHYSQVPTDRRVAMFNDGIKHAKDEEVIVRTRINARSGEREIYTVTARSYTPIDVDELVTTAKRLAGDAFASFKGEIIYDPNTLKADARFTIHADEIVDLSAGDAFTLGFGVASGDARNRSVTTYNVAQRNLCKNFIILATEIGNRRRLRHTRNVRISFAANMKEALKTFAEGMQVFGEDWNIASNCDIASFEPLAVDAQLQARERVEAIMQKVYGLPAMREVQSAVSRDAAVEVLLGGWDSEPGENLTAIVNAVTRAHERVPIELVPAFEKAGGELLRYFAKEA